MSGVLIISIFTFLLMFIAILFDFKIKLFKVSLSAYWVITSLAAILLVCLRKVKIEEIVAILTNNSSINPLKIIILFFSMSFISIFLDKAGFFNVVAAYCINKAKSNQFKIFTILYFAISILTVFTSNDIIILTFTPFICYFCKNLNINPTPYLISEFVAANTLSMALIIGNPTNIYLSLNANIDFITYFNKMFFLSILVCFIAYFLMLLVFKRLLKVKIESKEISLTINNKFYIIVGLLFLIIATILMAVSSYINIPMYLISFSCAIALLFIVLFYNLINKKHDYIIVKSLRKIPYELFFFLISMVVIILSMNNCNIVSTISSFLSEKNSSLLIGYSSFFMCSIMNNIPMSILYSNIFSYNAFPYNAIYCCIISSNIGALFTPLGALAGIMFLNIIKSFEIKNFTFKTFIKYCMPLSLILLSISFLLLAIA
ncbi:MAG: SLC13 family permease [Candidatus Caccosoma sp.]|nr:SLC13 family permease [Candidatus Caccosoma sp.]